MCSDATRPERASNPDAPDRGGASRGFLKDVLRYVPALIVPAIVGIVTVPVVTRLFDPDEYGILSVAYATIAIAMTLIGWIPAAVIRFHPAAERQGTLRTFFGTVQSLTALSVAAACALGALLLLGARSILDPRLLTLLAIGLVMLTTDSFLATYQHVLRARRKVATYSLIAALKSAGTLGLGVLFVVGLGLGVSGLLWGSVVTGLLILPLAWWRALGPEGRGALALDRPLAAAMARYSVPLVTGNLAGWVLNLSDRYVIEFTRGSYEVGVYAVAYDFGSRAMLLVVSLFTLAAGPLAMRIWEQKGVEASRLFATDVTRYFLLATMAPAVGLASLSAPVMQLMAGEAYLPGHHVLGLVALGVLLLGLQSCFQVGLLFHKRTVAIAVSLLVAGVLNVVLNVLLVPIYGYVAAAVTTVLSYGVLFVLVVVVSRRYFTWSFPWPTLLRVLVASAATAAVLLGVVARLSLSPALQVVVGALVGGSVYVVTLLLLGELRASEKAACRRAWSRLLEREGDAS